MKKSIILIFVLFTFLFAFTQDKVLKLDFETNSFINSSKLPYAEPFIITGEISKNVEMIEIQVFNENEKKPLSTYTWSRSDKNLSELFEVAVTESLISNSKYDFTIVTFVVMSEKEKQNLIEDISKRIIYYLKNQYDVDGGQISIKNPKNVNDGLNTLIKEAFSYQRSKNEIHFSGLSNLVKDELYKQRGFKFKKLLKNKNTGEQDSLSNSLLNKKILYMTDIIISEIVPYLNSQLVQQERRIFIGSVETEKEHYTIPVNAGLYVWSTNTVINNTSVKNTSLSPGFGISIPFKRNSRMNSNTINSFGISLGVFSSPVKNANNVEFVTPTVNLPVYVGLGIKFFNIIRLNTAAIIVSEKGVNNVDNLKIYPTVGIALELDLWLGIRK